MDPFQPSPLRQSHKIEVQEAPCSLQLLGQEQEHANPESNHQKRERRASGAKAVNNFIQKTFDILQQKRFESIVSWADNTELSHQPKNPPFQDIPNALNSKSNSEKICSFKIHNLKAFEEIVLPQYFKHSNMSSFVRQLNMYNFHKVRGDKNQFQFEHELFIKNRPDLLCEIKRKQIQSTASIPSISLILQPEQQPHYPQQPSKMTYKQAQNAQFRIQDEYVKQKIQENQNISFQEIESPQKGQKSVVKLSSNEQENLNYRLAELQQMNRNLKKTKQMKQASLKQITGNNKNNITNKFNKIVMAIIAAKLQQDNSNKILVQNESKYNLANLHTIVEHIMDNSAFKTFKEYIKTVQPLFEGLQDGSTVQQK